MLHTDVCCVPCKRNVASLVWMDGLVGRFTDTSSLRRMKKCTPQVTGVCLSVPEAVTDEEGPLRIHFVQRGAVFCRSRPVWAGAAAPSIGRVGGPPCLPHH